MRRALPGRNFCGWKVGVLEHRTSNPTETFQHCCILPAFISLTSHAFLPWYVQVKSVFLYTSHHPPLNYHHQKLHPPHKSTCIRHYGSSGIFRVLLLRRRQLPVQRYCTPTSCCPTQAFDDAWLRPSRKYLQYFKSGFWVRLNLCILRSA